MFLDFTNRKILETLGKNSRATIKEISKNAECTVQTASKRLKKLGLKHGIEININSIQTTTEYFIRVKFNDKKRDVKKINTILSKNPYIQLACLTKGDFDLFIWALAPNPKIYERDMEAKIRVALDEYIQDWTAHGLLLKRGGFLPINQEIINLFPLKNTDKATLLLLNLNSRTTITQMAKQFSISKPAALYRLEKALKHVRRCTSFLGPSKNMIYAIRFFQICGTEKILKKHAAGVYNLYLHPEQRFGPFNKTIYAAVPDGGMDNFFVEAFDSLDDLDAHNKVLKKYEGTIIRKSTSAVVTKVLKGTIPARVIDLREDIPYLLTPVE